jgi:hypothetical protein
LRFSYGDHGPFDYSIVVFAVFGFRIAAEINQDEPSRSQRAMICPTLRAMEISFWLARKAHIPHTPDRKKQGFSSRMIGGWLIGRHSSIRVEPLSELHHQCVAWILSG